jgi:uncharacterized DUF497 family protein
MLRILQLIWDDWNEEHIGRHRVDRDEVEYVCFSRSSLGVRIRRGRYRVIGQTDSGRYLTVILDFVGKRRYYVVTARDADEAERRRLRASGGR